MNAPSWIGRTIGGRYRIEQLLGQGGMSAVYKANDPNLKRVVAVKLIHAHLSGDPRFLHRFEEEAAAVAQLRHPNIIQVFDFNQDDGTYYMVMEFIPGETLQDRLRRYNRSQRLISLSKAVQYTIDICSAVGYAHKRGLVHRDIKPANIMLDVQDQAILMDFGIVKIVGAETFTATGAVVGTALYMPPEIIRGETPDPRSDLYSLGVTLYEMTCGKPPFEAESAMTLMMMHLNDPVPDLSQMRPGVPSKLVEVIKRVLAKDLADRYASAEELVQALKALQPELASQEPDGTSTSVEQVAPKFQAAATPISSQEQPATEAELQAELKPTSEPVKKVVQAEATLSELDQPTIFPTITDPQPKDSQVLTPPAKAQQVSPPGFSSLIGRINFKNPILIGAALLVFAIFIVGGILFISKLTPRGAGSGTATVDTISKAASATQPILAAVNPETSTPTRTSTVAPTNTATSTPTRTSLPTDTPTPSATPTPELFVVVKNITVENNRYIVDYETFGYTEKLPGMHVHFFFDTVLPENAGLPGSGPWKLYGGPRPFKDYRLNDRPNQANQMCALVANADHSVILNSGTCLDLP